VDKTDKRVINVCLTPNGEKLRSVAKDILEYNKKIYEGISNDEKCNFYKILIKMTENINNIEENNTNIK
jgi:DNA-binding MarR family transcriptional regulator